MVQQRKQHSSYEHTCRGYQSSEHVQEAEYCVLPDALQQASAARATVWVEQTGLQPCRAP